MQIVVQLFSHDSLLQPGELMLSSSPGGLTGGVDGDDDSDDSFVLVDARGGAPHATPSFLMSPLFGRGELVSLSSPGGSTGGIER